MQLLLKVNEDKRFRTCRGGRRRDLMVVRFTITYAISAYHH